MKILHLASFTGNIGDNASHRGFYNILDDLINNYTVDQLEIRKFYKNYDRIDKMFFDQSFIDKINTYDFCFIGGGGFLDYWVENSQSGTTIDISPNLLNSIKTPTIFTSIGSNPHKLIPPGNIDKFRFFLDRIIENKNIHIALRNDGSVESFKNEIGSKYLNNFKEILDHGFFYNIKKDVNRIIDNQYVAINITEDQLKMQSKNRGDLDIDNYYNQLVITVNYIIKTLKFHVVFIPHIYSDLKAITKLLDLLEDSLIRKHITVAPCVQGFNGADNLFSVYQKSEFVIGSRFHANVCSLTLGKKTIGLLGLDRISYLFDYFGMKDSTINLEKNFSAKLIARMSKRNTIKSQLLQEKKLETIEFYKNIFKKYS